MIKNWKTTSAGIVAIAGGLTTIVFAVMEKHITPELVTASLTAILTGVGLIFAKDHNISGTDVPKEEESA